ncbi:MAG: ribonuclease HII [Candidatus Lokiarchaeota archaeon]|nr:ribonuclease HII [Candidatus Lokiarchaeota archaeon]
MKKRIMGLDEAGRGPVLGDLYIGAVLCSPEQVQILEDNQIDDSKKLSSKTRSLFYEIIKNNCLKYLVRAISIAEIDGNIKRPGLKSLNDLEKELMRDLICELDPDIVYIDAIGSNPKKFKKQMINLLEERMETSSIPKIIAENKGDSLFTIVGAASIMAKVDRDNAIDSYKKEFIKYGDIGSGYPSDWKTRAFLKKYIQIHKKPPNIARKSWDTTKNIIRELQQTKLTDF